MPGNDWGIFYPTSIGVPIVQVMFMGGVALAAVGLLGLSPRTGGTGWRGALSAVSAGGARLRVIATALFAAGIALAVIGFGLAGTATGSPSGGYAIPAFDNVAGAKPIAYTPVCAGTTFPVCVHPAYRTYLPSAVAALDQVVAELAGLPGVPVRATEVPDGALSSAVLSAGNDGGVVGNPPVYEFSMDNAVALVPDASMFKDGIQQDIVHAVIVGRAREMVEAKDGSDAFQPNPGSPAQQAVVNGLLQALGAAPFPVGDIRGNSPHARQFRAQQAQIATAAARFAALPAATRHAWLVANLAALKAGHITLAQLP